MFQNCNEFNLKCRQQTHSISYSYDSLVLQISPVKNLFIQNDVSAQIKIDPFDLDHFKNYLIIIHLKDNYFNWRIFIVLLPNNCIEKLVKKEAVLDSDQGFPGVNSQEF